MFPMSGMSVGSGWVCQSDGVIITNNHVVEEALKYGGGIKVNLGRKVYEAKVMGNDPVADVAFLKIDTDGEKLPTMHFGVPPRKGEHIALIGNPLGLNQNFNTGVVSDLYQTFGGPGLPGHVTDAAVNPGNSGGVVSGRKGDVKGTVNAKIMKAGVDNIGFFIPNQFVQGALQRLSEGKSLNRMTLGLVLAEKNSLEALRNELLEKGDLSEAKALDQAIDALIQHPVEEHGLVLTEIQKASIAGKTGLFKTGDIITALNGKPVGTLHEFVASVKAHFEDDVLTIDLIRRGAPMTLQIQNPDLISSNLQ
jgi:S1-C subfamily serine protease